MSSKVAGMGGSLEAQQAMYANVAKLRADLERVKAGLEQQKKVVDSEFRAAQKDWLKGPSTRYDAALVADKFASQIERVDEAIRSLRSVDEFES